MANSIKNLNRSSKENKSSIIIKKQFDTFGREKIFNKFGQVIATLEIPLFKLDCDLRIHDLLNDKLIIFERRDNLLYKIQEIKDNYGNLLARVRMFRFQYANSKIVLVDNKGRKRFVAIGDFKDSNYKIINISNNEIIAQIMTPNKENLIFKNLKLDFKNYYIMNFINNNVDKMRIISFVISINQLIFKFRGVSNIAGFERRIARLRPFGPGKSLN